MDKNMIIRLFVLLFTLTNLILTECGVNPLPISDELAYETVSVLVTCAAALWTAWKNNNFSLAAKLSQRVLDAIKSGRITAQKVEDFITENSI